MGLGINNGAIGLHDRVANPVFVLPVKRAGEYSFRLFYVNLSADLLPSDKSASDIDDAITRYAIHGSNVCKLVLVGDAVHAQGFRKVDFFWEAKHSERKSPHRGSSRHTANHHA